MLVADPTYARLAAGGGHAARLQSDCATVACGLKGDVPALVAGLT